MEEHTCIKCLRKFTANNKPTAKVVNPICDICSGIHRPLTTSNEKEQPNNPYVDAYKVHYFQKKIQLLLQLINVD